MNEVRDRLEVFEPLLLNRPVVMLPVGQKRSTRRGVKVPRIGLGRHHLAEGFAVLHRRHTTALGTLGWPGGFIPIIIR